MRPDLFQSFTSKRLELEGWSITHTVLHSDKKRKASSIGCERNGRLVFFHEKISVSEKGAIISP